MRKAYLSMPADTPKSIRHLLTNYILTECNCTEVSFWSKGTPYKDKDLLNADLVYSYVPEFAWHQDNDEYVFLGKGQYSEWEKIVDDTKFAFIRMAGTESFGIYNFSLYHPEHGTINDYNDWKRKYGKVWVSPMFDKAPTIEGKRRMLLLLD